MPFKVHIESFNTVYTKCESFDSKDLAMSYMDNLAEEKRNKNGNKSVRYNRKTGRMKYREKSVFGNYVTIKAWISEE